MANHQMITKNIYRFSTVAVMLLLVQCTPESTDPVPTQVPATPYDGAAYIDPIIISDDDPSVLLAIAFVEEGERYVYDFRNQWTTIVAHVFQAKFDGMDPVEIAVNTEFTFASAEKLAGMYAHSLGKLPLGLRQGVKELWIHDGNNTFGAGPGHITIHHQYGHNLWVNGWLDEVMLHEATHAAFDRFHNKSAGWLLAQELDSTFISAYARLNPEREDMAETMVAYFAQRVHPQRLHVEDLQKIRQTIRHRIAFLDDVQLNMSPYE